MISFTSSFGMTESARPLLSPCDAARLARAFAVTLPPGGRVLLAGDGSGAVQPAMLACMAQLAFMGRIAVPLAGGNPAMIHQMIPHGNFAGGMGFAGTGCWLAGSDGRCLNAAMWECVQARFDGGVPEDMPRAAICGEPDESLILHYWEQLAGCCDADRIRAAKLRIACCGLADHARFGELFGVEMLPFDCPEALAGAIPYLQVHGGMIFEPAGKALQLVSPAGTFYTPDTVMLLGSFIALEKGEKNLVSGGFASKSWNDLLLEKYSIPPCIVPCGEGSVITAGTVCGDLCGHFSFGGHTGYDALRTAAYILDFLASGGSIPETLKHLQHYHTVRTAIPGGADQICRLKGHFNAEETTEYDGGYAFEFADGRLSVSPLAGGSSLIFSEAKKLQDAHSRLDTARTVLQEDAI